MKTSVFEQSLIDNPLPKNKWEKRFTIETGISLTDPEEDIKKLKEEHGDITIKYREKKHKSCTLIVFWRDRTELEIVEYKRNRLENVIFRWLRDGKRRFVQIVSDKEASFLKYKNKMKSIAGWNHVVMGCKLNKMQKRINFYQHKIDHINFVIENYTTYTFEELENIPNRVFFDKTVDVNVFNSYL